MQRNWDKIREILITLEDMPAEKGSISLSDFPKDEEYEYSYNTELLIEAGLIYGEMEKTIGTHASDFLAARLTWEGHEFLDAIHSDNVWEKTKTSFVKGGLSMTFDLVKTVATDIAASYLKSVTGS
jgi:hypothetical protein